MIMKRRNFLKLLVASLVLTAPALFAKGEEKGQEKPDKSKRIWGIFTFLFDEQLQGKHRIRIINGKDRSKDRTYGWSSARVMGLGVEPEEIVLVETESGLLSGINMELTMHYGAPRWMDVDMRTRLRDDGFSLTASLRKPATYYEMS